MKPPKILLFVSSVLAILGAISIVFPKEGIRIIDRITLHFLTPGEILGKDTVQYADISGILNSSIAISDSAYLAMLEPANADGMVMDTIRANADSLKMKIHSIEYPQGDSTLLYPLFRKMRSAFKTGTIIEDHALRGFTDRRRQDDISDPIQTSKAVRWIRYRYAAPGTVVRIPVITHSYSL